jgi:muramoyltetrapeptide carboxypeptidase
VIVCLLNSNFIELFRLQAGKDTEYDRFGAAKIRHMIIPPFLKPGDKIGIAAPARKVTREELEPAVAIISSWGFEPVFAANLFSSFNQFSGTDHQRADDINSLLNDPSIKAIISARGGYGCLRIIDSIDWTLLDRDPKWIIGYSDVTAFESLLFNRGIASIHGTMAFSFGKNEEATEGVRKILTGEKWVVETLPHQSNKVGSASGKLCGGNLSLLFAMQGSNSFPKTEGSILFIEDLDEYLYHIDRMMLSLKRSGSLKGLKALVVGGMSDMKDNAVPYGQTAEEIILDAVSEYNYPVCFNFPAGHIERNLPLMIGGDVTLDVSNSHVSLRFDNAV